MARPHRNVGDVLDAVELRQLRRQLVHVFGEDGAGEAHHDGGIEGFTALQVVDGVVAGIRHDVIQLRQLMAKGG